MDIKHQYDCQGNHRITIDNAVGGPSSYEHPAFFLSKEGKLYMAVTPYYEGTVPHYMCQGVFELTRIGEEAVGAVAYNLFQPEEPCPWLKHTEWDRPNACSAVACPQKKGS